MLGLTTTITGPDLRGKTAKAAMKKAQDRGLAFHRAKFMPLHFESFSPSRYPGAYARAAGKYSRDKSATSRKNGTARRSVNRERRMEKSSQQSNNTSTATTAAKKRPIFDSGLTRNKILKGGVKITGRYDKRGMTFNPPFYIKINPAGQLNKVNALNAIRSSEEAKDAKIVDKLFFKELEKNQTTQKG